jgi:uncharacterized HhH-GPD family protein
MGGRVQQLCRAIVEDYGGDPERIWRDAPDGAALYRSVKALPGFGEQKARIFVALLGKQRGVNVPGWREAAGDYGRAGTFMSVADIDGPDTLVRVRQYKKEMKARAQASKAVG